MNGEVGGPGKRRVRMSAQGMIALTAVIGSALFSGYTWYYAKHHPVKEIVYVDKWGAVRSKIITATVTAFRSQNKMIATSMDGIVRVKSTRNLWFLTGSQEISMPASVTYQVDLKSVKAEDVSYDPYQKVLFVKLPPLEISAVTFNMEKASQANGGLLTVNDEVRQQLSKINYQNANMAFTNLARDKGRLDAARASAQKNVSSLLEIPLKATGNGGISVRAYF